MRTLYFVARVRLDLESLDVTVSPLKHTATFDHDTAHDAAERENGAVAHLPADGEQVSFDVLDVDIP